VLAFALFFVTFLAVCVAVAAGILQRRNLSRVAALPLEDDEVMGGTRS